MSMAGSFSAARLAPSGLWESIMSGNLRGDLLVALSAVFYSLHVVRLGEGLQRDSELCVSRDREQVALLVTFFRSSDEILFW